MRHQFVEHIPETLDPDTLYVSIEYNIAVHKCACGCGVDVVTPLSPAEWALTYDGETISLWPSIGNWSFPCKSHYVIKRGQVRWAARFDAQRIGRVQTSDAEALARQYGGLQQQIGTKADFEESGCKAVPHANAWKRLIKWIFG
jgi:hypothetical protein